ncbi:MAG: hypothetical protein EXS25_01520 [Pedosphaera sp.]|nr:hypothetical protein [Pedosphaera sp.]
MYPFEFGTGGTRPVAPTFASFDTRFDTRDAQFLMGWKTESWVQLGLPTSRYILSKVRLSVSVSADQTFIYDPTFDSYRTHLGTNEIAWTRDQDGGRPVEFFGTGFRNGFTAETYANESPYGPVGGFTSDTISVGTRNAFAAVYDTEGNLIDTSNHVGQRNANWTNASFEAVPWAVGLTAQAIPGALVPVGSVFTFDLDLSDPLIAGYLGRALSAGTLDLMLSSLSPAQQVTPGGTGFGGLGSYPQWSTHENLLFKGPLLEVEGTVIRDTDSDVDGLPDDWERLFLGDLSSTGTGDADGDGLVNQEEFIAGTNPRSAESTFRLTLSGPPLQTELSFRFAPGRRYRVEQSEDLTRWIRAAGQLSYPSRGVCVWKADVQQDSSLFYRVRVDEIR